MNWILVLLALFFAYPVFTQMVMYAKIKKAKILQAEVLDVAKSPTFTRLHHQLLQGGKTQSIIISYSFIFNNKEFKTVNDKFFVSPKNYLTTVKIGDKIKVYALLDDNEKLKDTYLVKPRVSNIIFQFFLVVVTLAIAYLSRNG